MTRRTTLALCVVALTASGAAGGMAACSSSSSGNPGSGSSSGGGSEASTDGPAVMGLVPEVACTDSIDSVYADPGDVSSQPKGAILKCAHDTDLTAAQLTALTQAEVDAGNPPYMGKAFTSGAHVYRVLYRTERGDPNNSPGYSSALLLLPETPRAGAGNQLPVVVAAHGSFGLAPGCAPSKNAAVESLSPTNGQYTQADYFHLVYPLVGLGYAVIAPDYAGYANFGGANNPPPTYDDTLDNGKSVLDAARALRKLIPSSVSQQAVIVGHSEGGSAALSALSIASSYGLDGVLAGVAVYSPLWFSRRAYGAVLTVPSLATFAPNGAVSMWYHWSHSALLDGPDAAFELFQQSKESTLQQFFGQDCWAYSYPTLAQNGAMNADDYFDPAYVQAITPALSPILGTGSCGDAGAAAQECQTWVDRMTADWPHLDGGAAQVPLLLWYAHNDEALPPDYMQCVLNRLAQDGVKATYCYDPTSGLLGGQAEGHAYAVTDNVDYVADWIAHETLPDAGAPTEPCQPIAPNDAGIPQLYDDEGGVVSCYKYIPNQ